MKRCKGCGRTDDKPLGKNALGQNYLACCPENNYEDYSILEWFIERSIEINNFEARKERDELLAYAVQRARLMEQNLKEVE